MFTHEDMYVYVGVFAFSSLPLEQGRKRGGGGRRNKMPRCVCAFFCALSPLQPPFPALLPTRNRISLISHLRRQYRIAQIVAVQRPPLFPGVLRSTAHILRARSTHYHHKTVVDVIFVAMHTTTQLSSWSSLLGGRFFFVREGEALCHGRAFTRDAVGLCPARVRRHDRQHGHGDPGEHHEEDGADHLKAHTETDRQVPHGTLIEHRT